MKESILTSEIEETIKSNYFAKTFPEVLETALSILREVSTLDELRPFITKYLKEDYRVRNLLVIAPQMLSHQEPIEVKKGDVIHIPSKIYKTGVEPARVLEIDLKEKCILVRPLRDRAEVIWVSNQYIKKEIVTGK